MAAGHCKGENVCSIASASLMPTHALQANGTEKKLGAYLMKTCFQTSTISSAMFITAMAANPLAVDLARDALGTTISWGTWALAGLVPGLVCLLATPLILYVLYPPEVKDTPDAPRKAR